MRINREGGSTVSLLLQVAHDYDFMREALKNTIQVDDFTGKLWNIYETIQQEGGPSQVRKRRHLCPSFTSFVAGKSGNDEVRPDAR